MAAMAFQPLEEWAWYLGPLREKQKKSVGQQSSMDFFDFSLILAFGTKTCLSNIHALETNVSLKIQTPEYSRVVSCFRG